MTIEIDRPEVEALIRERLLKGGFSDPQDVILHALRATVLVCSDPDDDIFLECAQRQKLLGS